MPLHCPPDPSAPTGPKPRWNFAFRIALITAFYVALLIGGAYIASVIRNLAGAEFGTIHAPSLQVIVIASALIFALTSALPFVPGAEIGLGMLMLLGGAYAPLVYFCMLFALMLAFSVGQWVPLTLLSRGFGWLNLRKTQALLERAAELTPQERLTSLLEAAPSRFVPLLLRYRYIAVLILVNTPGNSLIGGGGGIALMAGCSGLFKWHHFALAMALAIAPIPIAFYLAH